MNLKPGILSLLLGAVLFSAGAAHADDDRRDHRRGERPSLINVHVHGAGCRHDTEPVSRPGGRYELRTVQSWVPGHHERVWVPEVCHTKHKKHSRRTVCRDGYYDERWVEGYYRQAEEWVWVPAPERPHRHHGAGIQVTARF
jgi:hypothetical protein